jgi:hypothetical protein
VPTLIALNSPVEQSGKTEVAKVLVAERGFVLVKFAAGLKQVCAVILREVGLPEKLIDRILDGDLKLWPIPELGGMCGRELMQVTGSDYGRDLIHRQLWVRSTYRRLQALASAGRDVVIDDLRHANELAMVRAVGGCPLRIVRPGAQAYNQHPSENRLDSESLLTLVNHGSLEDLRAMALVLPEHLSQGL